MPSPDRPLVSFLVIAYNQEKFIEDAVEGAFAQTYSPLEIILSDDCSTDGTFAIMKAMAAKYKGPHQVVLNRNQQNLGIGRHYSRVMEMASGEIVEIAAGDDISLPWRTADSVSLLNANPELTCVSLAIQHFRENPIIPPDSPTNLKLEATWSLGDFANNSGFLINAPGRAFRKYTHDFYGPLIEDCPVEDGSSLLRCLLHGDVATCEKVAVLYRWNGENISSPDNISKIKFSPIYADFLNTVHIAFKQGQIDLHSCRELTKIFEAERDKFSLLDSLHSNRFGFFALTHVLASSHFSLRERIKLFLKGIIRLTKNGGEKRGTGIG